MKTRIQKWGNSLALRIPKTLADGSRLKQGALVELEMETGRLIVTPITKTSGMLKDLLAKITEENVHESVETGRAQGSELW